MRHAAILTIESCRSWLKELPPISLCDTKLTALVVDIQLSFCALAHVAKSCAGAVGHTLQRAPHLHQRGAPRVLNVNHLAHALAPLRLLHVCDTQRCDRVLARLGDRQWTLDRALRKPKTGKYASNTIDVEGAFVSARCGDARPKRCGATKKSVGVTDQKTELSGVRRHETQPEVNSTAAGFPVLVGDSERRDRVFARRHPRHHLDRTCVADRCSRVRQTSNAATTAST